MKLNDKLSQQNKINQDLQDQIIQKNLEITQLKQYVEELLAKIKKLEELISHLKQDLESKESQIHSLTITLNEHVSECTTLREQVTHITRIKLEGDQNNKTLRTEQSGLKQTIIGNEDKING